MSVNRPDIEVALGFTVTLMDALASVAWVDVSDLVELDSRRGGAPISIRRGRATELDRVEAGTCSLYLRNRDRQFDPEYTGSVYWPLIAPRRVRLRIRARWPRGSGTWRALSTGVIDRWTPVYPAGRQALVRIDAVDAFDLFARMAYSDGMTLPPGELHSNAIQSILNNVGWPVADRAFPYTSTAYMPLIAWSDTTALAAMQQIAAADGATFFIGPDGMATYHDRSYRWRNATPLAFFGDDPDTTHAWVIGASVLGVTTIPREAGWTPGTSSEVPYERVTWSMDSRQIRNDVRVTRRNGEAQVATDSGSSSVYGRLTYEETDVLLAADTEALAKAQWLLLRYASPHLRADSVVINGELAPDRAWPALLTLEMDDLVHVRQRPPGGGTRVVPCRVDAVTHTIAPGAWRTEYRLSRDETLDALVLDDATHGRLDYQVLGY